ncbi:SPOR domain-containing protein [Pedobacter glucosidilyticus]|uniref:HU domain-containing protein n=1 Tax=Pedobacter glucosidilyticus TaxID=1122941 RepID=UPI000417B836|nr:SPOR domain-containing protein [Pedobacter glucosidilyticus]
MDISFNIKDILDKHSLVILPDLGVFYKKRQEGFYDDQKQAFCPPKEIIGFSNIIPEESQNPALEYICKTRKVSMASADYLLNQFVSELRDILNQKNELPLQGLGKLIKKDEVLVFEEEKAIETNLAYFGLPLVSLTTHNETESTKDKHEEEELSFSLAEQALQASLPITDGTHKRKSNRWIFIFIPVIVVLITALSLYFIRPDLYNQYFNPNLYSKDNKVVVPIGLPQENSRIGISQKDATIADSVYNEIEKNAKAQGLEIEKIKDSTNVTISNTAVPNKSDIRYEIIIAAWQTRAKAEDQVKKLKANGINAFIVEDADGPMIKISAATFYNKAEAEAELKRVREELNPEAFIKPIKPLK